MRRAGYLVSVSHEILPEFREYERTSTTVINAYLAPVMSGYLAGTQSRVRTAWFSGPKPKTFGAPRVRVHIMQSNGGVVSAEKAAREPVTTILSGPAGGVTGAAYAARLAGIEKVITFDMGGTSTDVALLSGELRTTSESTAAGFPVAVPMLEIHTVGAGGGSIARFDRGGALRVGPESAGAEPGPICYGRGELPTVTDAHAVLGHFGGGGIAGRELSAGCGAGAAGDAGALMESEARAAAFRERREICRGDFGGRGCGDGEGDSRDFRRARARSARLHAGGVRRRGRAARVLAGVGAGDARRAAADFSRGAVGAGDLAGGCGDGIFADGAADGIFDGARKDEIEDGISIAGDAKVVARCRRKDLRRRRFASSGGWICVMRGRLMN